MKGPMTRLAALVAAASLVLTACTRPTEEPQAVDSPLLQARQAAGIADCPVAPPTEPVADGLPNLTLQCLGTGSESTLSGLPKGRPLVINLWAQWCGPCREEAPILAAVSKKGAGSVDFLGIDTADPQPDLAIEFARLAGWTYPQLVDPERRTREPPLSAPGLPHTFFVDKDGRVVGSHSGQITSEEQLTTYLQDLFGYQP